MQPTLPTHLLSRLSELLAAQTGLHFPAERWGDLERGIAATAIILGMPDVESCAHRILSAPLTHREIEILTNCLTVGETYFFREKESLEAVEQYILPSLLQAREKTARPLRIWSAGCCTGEEPYSIAMLLDRMLPNANAPNITLLATDINPEFLHKGAEGEYGEWSFRGVPNWIKRRYFQPHRNGRFKIDEQIRKRVTFAYLNLAKDAYPSLTNNTNAMDIIFCRNVLMYFSIEQAGKVIDNLHRSLVDGGWLIVSPAETSSALFSRFTSVEFAGALLYRRDDSAKAQRHVSHVSTPLTDSVHQPWRLTEQIMPTAEAMPQPIPATSQTPCVRDNSAAATPEQGQPSHEARECANQGKLTEAAKWCEKAIAADKLNPAHRYLLSAIQQEQGLGEDAAQSLAHALYLDPDFVLAHYALGNLRQSQGRQREANRHFDNALTTLHSLPPDEILPEADGLTAGRLAEIIATMQSNRPQLVANQ